MEIIKGNGIDLKIKRPKRTKIGLSTPESMDAVRQQIAQNSGISHVTTKNGQATFSGADVNRIASGEDNVVVPKQTERKRGMSFEELLADIWEDNSNMTEETGVDDNFFEYEVFKHDLKVETDRNVLEKKEAGKDRDTGDSLTEEPKVLNIKKREKVRKKAKDDKAVTSAEDFISGKKRVNTGSYIAIGTGVFGTILIVIGVVIIVL